MIYVVTEEEDDNADDDDDDEQKTDDSDEEYIGMCVRAARSRVEEIRVGVGVLSRFKRPPPPSTPFQVLLSPNLVAKRTQTLTRIQTPRAAGRLSRRRRPRLHLRHPRRHRRRQTIPLVKYNSAQVSSSIWT